MVLATNPNRAMSKAMAKKWIQGMHLKKGALHRQLGVPSGQKIPAKTLAVAAQKGGVIGRRARLAETFRHMKKK